MIKVLLLSLWSNWVPVDTVHSQNLRGKPSQVVNSTRLMLMASSTSELHVESCTAHMQSTRVNYAIKLPNTEHDLSDH